MNRSRFLINPARLLIAAAMPLTGPERRRLLIPGTRILLGNPFTPRRLAMAAVTAPGFYLPTWIDTLDTTQLALDLDLETHKVALFSDTVTPNFSTDTAYGVAPYNANECSGGSWPAGGVALGTTTFTEAAAGSMVWDAADVSQATSTITAAMAALAYADALAGNNAILLSDFVTAVNCGGGTMEIIWTAPASGGIGYIDLTP